MDTWLKFRSKTPLVGSRTPTLPSTPSLDNGTNPFEFGHDFEDELRLRPTSRVSSFLNFGKQNTPATDSSSFPSPSFGHENHTLDGKAAQNVWHNPNTEQMAESLKVAMMTRGNFEPVPVEYNSNILHVLEAYWAQSQELKKKDQELMELKVQLNQQMDEVELLGKEWSVKEGQYKTELKKLEVMVANGVAGLEAVTLARCNSALDRSNSKIEERIRQIREGSDGSKGRRYKKMTASSSEDKDVKLSRMFRERRHRKTERQIDEHLRPNKIPSVELEVVHPHLEVPNQQSRNSSQESVSLTQSATQHRYYDSTPTSNDTDGIEQGTHASSVLSPNNQGTYATYAPSVMSPNNDSKPLPDLPLTESDETVWKPDDGNGEESFRKTHAKSNSHNRALSYVPGDDSFQWRRQQPQLLAKHFELRDSNKLNREDSNSSVVTAIQDEPAKSDKRTVSESGKKPDAAVAAARAMAAHEKGGY